MTETTPPPLQVPSSKEKKYDRQLRLWAASGQAALENAHVLLINSGTGVVGVEALKNLVLPGVGNFTILDSAVVAEADLGVNFFLEDGSLEGFRAEHTCRLLQELNPDVQGNFITEPIETFIIKPNALSPYTLILVTSPVDPDILAIISEHSRATSTPVFYIHCAGFYSEFALQLPQSFPIVDTHPDPASTTDLRLLTPWPELVDFATQKTKDLEAMSDHDHGHVPYLLLLLHYLEEWKKTHAGQVPTSYGEKSEFRELVRRGERTSNAEGGEENFDEAVAAVLKTLVMPSPSSGLREVFAAEECQSLTNESANFWVVAHAISLFYKMNSALPLPGSVPDMKAQSADYIQLQNVYKAKARQDLANILDIVRKLENELSRQNRIDEREVEAFCKGADFVKLVRGRPLQIARGSESLKWGDRAKASASALRNLDSLILLHIAFLAFDIFTYSHNVGPNATAPRPPGWNGSDGSADTESMRGIALKLINDLLTEASIELEDEESSDVDEKIGSIVQELTRAGGAELHNIAALTGGLVAQEVIKVITKQYVPVDNVCMFDGVQSKSAVLRV